MDIINQYGQSPALICNEQACNYLEYGRLIENTANRLISNGINKNDRVALVSADNGHCPPVIMALLHIGAVAVPISTRFPAGIVSSLLKKTNCGKLVIGKNYRNLHLPKKLKILEQEDLFYPDKNNPFDLIRQPLSFRQDATILFTSGSCGEPKAVLHDFGSHYYSAVGSNMNIPLNPDDRWLLSIPLYHAGGMAILFRTLVSGAATVIRDSRSSIAENIERFKVTHISLVSTQLHRLLQDERSIRVLRSLKAILLGGSRFSGTLLRRSVEKGLPVYASYGLTETASQVCTTSAGYSLDSLSNAGKVLNHRRIKTDENGEILVKGKTLFKGYVEEEGIRVNLDGDGWFKTGDIGRIDDYGYLSIIGRKDNMFISGGENIHPEEIEECLLQMPEIERAMVVSVSDDEFGERPAAFIKLTKNQKTAVDKIRRHLRETLPPFKIPDHFLPWPELEEDLKPNRKLFKEIAHDNLCKKF